MDHVSITLCCCFFLFLFNFFLECIPYMNSSHLSLQTPRVHVSLLFSFPLSLSLVTIIVE